MSRSLDRRQFIESTAFLGIAGTAFPLALYETVEHTGDLTIESIMHAEAVAGLTFTAEQRELMLDGLVSELDSYRALRDLRLPNHVLPCQFFDPDPDRSVTRLSARPDIGWNPGDVSLPGSDEDLAFSSVATLAALLKSRKISSVELTELYLSRLRRYDDVLHAVVTYTDDRAFRMARQADEELDRGMWRGPLHGIPWGAKDLLSVAGYPTTWGAQPYRDQRIEEDARIVRLLDEAGAVLVAKLSLGALAMGDVWFGGRTRNPWNVETGSSGSSAGPGAAVAAGLVGFAIGSETLGSIVSPSTVNGVSGFRPSFGRISRAGAMTLSWTMDKLGPMCRSAEDCALVFSAIHGHHDDDPTSVTLPFEWPVRRKPGDLRVGYLKEAFEADYRDHDIDRASLDVLTAAGVELVPIALPEHPIGAIRMMLIAEAAAAFDTLTLSEDIDTLVAQHAGAWPNSFRKARLMPAVEYINASRARSLLIRDMKSLLSEFDAYITPRRGSSLLITNLTGHPSVTVPNGFSLMERDDAPAWRRPSSITVVGNLYKDAEALAIAHAFQSATEHHLRRPPIS